jgi:hypothetical protein
MAHLSTKFAMIAFVACAGIWGLPTIPARAQQPASFQSSCKDISIAGATLSAICRRKDGSFNQTSIVLRGIANINGQLRLTQPDAPATFQDSCQNIHVVGNTLTATCRRADGSSSESSILIPEITNIDGNLQF